MSPDPQFPLRLPTSLRKAAEELAFKEGVSLNHFISLALTEKVGRIEQQATFKATDAEK